MPAGLFRERRRWDDKEDDGLGSLEEAKVLSVRVRDRVRSTEPWGEYLYSPPSILFHVL